MEREFEEERRRQEAAILADLDDEPVAAVTPVATAGRSLGARSNTGGGAASGGSNGGKGDGGKGWVVTKPKTVDYDDEEMEGTRTRQARGSIS